MIKYVIKRLITGVIALSFLVLLTFIMVHKMPGNPFDTGNVSDQMLELMEEEYGMNEPIEEQYRLYVRKLMRGDLGESIKKPGTTVRSIIERSFPITLRLGIYAFLISLVLGGLVGVWQILTKNSGIRKMILVFQSLGVGIPNFAYALLLMLFFGVYLKWFPIAGIGTASNYVLPVASLALYPICVISRMIYSIVEGEFEQGYVKFLEAKGLRKSVILTKHMWRPVLAKLLVYLGQLLVYLMTGCFVVENIFTIPGLGREIVSSINNRDYTVIMGLTIFIGIIVIVIQMILDMIQMYLDPRIRFGMEQGI